MPPHPPLLPKSVWCDDEEAAGLTGDVMLDHAPKSFVVVRFNVFELRLVALVSILACCCPKLGAAAVCAGAGSGVAHALSEAQRSLENPEEEKLLDTSEEVVGAGAAGLGAGTGCDKLKIEFRSELCGFDGCPCGFVVGTAAAGGADLGGLAEKSKSPPAPLELLCCAAMGEAKSPKPLKPLLVLRVSCITAEGAGLAAGFGGGLGPESKNPPPIVVPLIGVEITCGGAGADLWVEGWLNCENADGLDWT